MTKAGSSAVIIGREIAMSALRELAASLGGEAYSAVAVSAWGKWKTASQVAALLLAYVAAQLTAACKGRIFKEFVTSCCHCSAKIDVLAAFTGADVINLATLQMAALTLLLYSAGGQGHGVLHEVSASLGLPLLGIASLLTVVSLAEYFRGMWKYL